MTPRRILIFSHAYYPGPIAGAEVAVKEITDRIAPGEIEFEMVTINGGGAPAESQVGNVKVHRLFDGFGTMQKLLFPFAAYLKAKKLHRAGNYDAVWSIMASYAGFASFLFKRKYKSIPFILTIQEGERFELRAGFLGFLFKKIFASADQITVLSNFLADWSKRMGAKCPITIVPNAVNVERFSRPVDPQRKKSLRSSLGFANGDIILVTASRLVHKNATEDTVSALNHLDPQVKLLILGSGPDESMLRELSARHKLEPRVVFKGFIDHQELPEYLQASDIFVRPSRTEGLGNSFLEAMAAGIPVIATPVGGIPDFLTDGETGLFCEVDNPQSIAQKVEKLIKDRESREYIVRNASNMVREKYDWLRISGEMKRVLLAN